MGLEYSLCKSRAQLDRVNIEHNNSLGKYFEGYDYPKMGQCLNELNELAKKSVDDTGACLEKTHQNRALDALDSYYGQWLAYTRIWKNFTIPYDQWRYQMELGDQDLENKKARLDATIR